MITPIIKDQILNELIACGTNPIVNTNKSVEIFGIETQYLNMILDQFERMGLISLSKVAAGHIYVSLEADAFDLQGRGGFFAAEEVVKASLEKLVLEIESLQKSFPDRALQFTSMFSNLAAIGTYFALK